MATTKTALQVVNLVMRNLRKNQVADFDASYTQLILEFVNQAKREIEDMIDWSHLRGQLSFNTVLDQTEYVLSAAGTTPVVASSVTRFANERSRIIYDARMRPQVVDTTNDPDNRFLCEIGAEENFRLAIMATAIGRIDPQEFSFASPAGIPTFKLSGKPVATRHLVVRMHLPQDDLALIGDTMLIPFAPVVLRATALAFDERGEELGSPITDWAARYEATLQEAIDRDTPIDQQMFYAD